MDLATLASFGAAFFVFAASPGPDNMTIVARTMSNGPSAGIAYGVGTVIGILLFLIIASFGLSMIAAEMGVALTILKYAGAAWLVWMGITLWTAPFDAPPTRPLHERLDLFSGFLTGVMLNLGNPKMPLFYLALLPNFIGAGLSSQDIGALALVILVVEILVIGGHVMLASRARVLFQTPQVMRRVKRVAGGTLIGCGIAVFVPSEQWRG